MLSTLGKLPKASVPGLACSWFVLLKKSQLSSGLEVCEPVVNTHAINYVNLQLSMLYENKHYENKHILIILALFLKNYLCLGPVSAY